MPKLIEGVAERPILMCGDMVCATLEDRKTHTRRIIKLPTPEVVGRDSHGELSNDVPREMPDWAREDLIEKCRFGRVGDQLWVREAWALRNDVDWATDEARAKQYCLYRAGYEGDLEDEYHPVTGWRPSIHMPRCLSRLTLAITDVRVERLQDIRNNVEAIESEGVDLPPTELYPFTNRGSKLTVWFSALWDKINGKGAWAANPWVWVVAFRRIGGEGVNCASAGQ